MLTIHNLVLPSPEQWEIIIEGMRNPMNSWDKTDSYSFGIHSVGKPGFMLGENDLSLMERLAKAGSDHRKYLRMIPVYVSLTAPLYWWKEYDTYKVGTVANSCSTMHKIHAKEFTSDDFSLERIADEDDRIAMNKLIDRLEANRKLFLATHEKSFWDTIIQLLPSSYNQRRTLFLNYEVLRNIYRARRNHKLDEWHTFCDFIETLPYSELITGEASDNSCTT